MEKEMVKDDVVVEVVEFGGVYCDTNIGIVAKDVEDTKAFARAFLYAFFGNRAYFAPGEVYDFSGSRNELIELVVETHLEDTLNLSFDCVNNIQESFLDDNILETLLEKHPNVSIEMFGWSEGDKKIEHVLYLENKKEMELEIERIQFGETSTDLAFYAEVVEFNFRMYNK